MTNYYKRLSIIGLLIVLACSYFSIKSLFIPGLFPMHDDTQVVRVMQMTKSIKDGLFPVRWVEDLGYGYGYPIFNFYAPFAYYIGAFITLSGVDVLVATKIMMGAGFIFAGVSMYYLAREFFGIKAAIISALLYVYAPYHALNLYVRGAVSEYWSYGFLPFFFLSFYKIFILLIRSADSSKSIQVTKSDYLFWSLINALSFAGVIISHNLSALMLMPYLGICLVFSIGLLIKNKKMEKIGLILYPFFLGLLLSAFYSLPALLEMNYTNVASQIDGKFDYRMHFVMPLQLWESQWGFGGSADGVIDGMSFRIGKIHLLLSVAAIFISPFILRVFKKQGRLMLICAVFLTGSILLTTSVSQKIWDILPIMKFIQFPWRFLSFVAFFSSLLGGSAVWASTLIINNVKLRYLSAILTCIIIIGIISFYHKLFLPSTIYKTTSYDYINEHNVKWTVSKISDEYMPKGFIKPLNFSDTMAGKVVILKGDPTAFTIVRKSTDELVFKTSSNLPLEILIRTAPFPSWRFFENGKSVDYIATNKGMVVKINSGNNIALLKLASTDVQKAGNALSIFGLVLVIVGIIRYGALIQKANIENK